MKIARKKRSVDPRTKRAGKQAKKTNFHSSLRLGNKKTHLKEPLSHRKHNPEAILFKAKSGTS